MQHTFSKLALAIAALSGSVFAQWVPVTTTTFPTARIDAAATWHPAGHVLLYGGAPTVGSPGNQTWTYNGTNWTQLSPTASPTGKAAAGLVYDTHRGVAVLYGGANASNFGGPSQDQTWEFDGTTWTRVITTVTPGGLGNFGIAYDTVRHRTVVYGGTANSMFPIASAGTWEYDGANWQQVTTANSPGPLERPAMCWDSGQNRVLLFGGIDPQIGGTNILWSYNGTNWSQVAVTGASPSDRTGARMVYDSARAVCVLYGGMNPTTGALLSDTWEWNGVSWTQIITPAPAPVRTLPAAAFDPIRRKVVIYGGANASFSAQTGTFEYGASYRTFGTGCAGSNGVPAISSTGAPRIGSTFTVQASNLATAATVAFMSTAISNTSSPLGALPLSLGGVGMPGCTLYTSADVTVLIPASAGIAAWNLSIPANAALINMPFFNQLASIDAAANQAGLTVSNAGAGVVGH